ncbi:MAG TPA: hypothetical protein VK891_16985 [Euzebyales bacterium]|nr:hypothetical protein [Euzebyales bacterium]
MTTKSRRGFMAMLGKLAMAGAGGLALGVGAGEPAEACAVYCRYSYTNNDLGSNCVFRPVFRCYNSCDGSYFNYCSPSRTSHASFCLYRNFC